MKKARWAIRSGQFILAAVLALWLVLAAVSSGWALDFPPPKGAVNDFANIIPPESRSRMTALAEEVLEKTEVSLVVATFATTGGRDIETFATALFSAWGVGKKGEDKGVLLLVALKERRFRIETGYGVEGVLPDGKLGRIRDEYILPYFKQGQFGPGFENGLKAIAAVLAQDAGVKLSGQPAQAAPRPSGKKATGFPVGLLALLLLFFVFARRRRGRGGIWPWLFLGAMMGSGRGGHYSGGFGGFGGGFGGFGGGMSGGGGVSGSF